MSVFPCSTETARSVAHALFSLEFVSELEQHSHDLAAFSGKDLTNLIERVEDARILPVLSHLCGMIEASWGVSLIVVFHHMGLATEAQRFNALLDLCLGCEGHGISIADDHQTELNNAEKILGRSLLPNPLSHDYEAFTLLAQEIYDNQYPAGNPQKRVA